ncbi:MAG: glutathione S-transferase family protein [Kofleriaceae bacterium]|nr:glutathione S-transferase family protein [Kofleriaceae bacterium]
MARPVRLFESSIPSGNAYKVSLMLSHLGIAIPHVQLDILAKPSETRRPEFLARNPNGRIPLLELDDGTHLPESNAILCFLADGTEYMPADPLVRARALSWMFFEQYSHEPYVAVLKFWTLYGGLHNKRPDEIALWKERGHAALGVMAGHLANHAWFTGEKYGIADIALFAYTQSAAQVGFDVPPIIDQWLGRVRAQPGYIAIKS